MSDGPYGRHGFSSNAGYGGGASYGDSQQGGGGYAAPSYGQSYSGGASYGGTGGQDYSAQYGSYGGGAPDNYQVCRGATIRSNALRDVVWSGSHGHPSFLKKPARESIRDFYEIPSGTENHEHKRLISTQKGICGPERFSRGNTFRGIFNLQIYQNRYVSFAFAHQLPFLVFLIFLQTDWWRKRRWKEGREKEHRGSGAECQRSHVVRVSDSIPIRLFFFIGRRFLLSDDIWWHGTNVWI